MAGDLKERLRTAALDAEARGWSVIPLCDPGHVCRAAGHPSHRPEKRGKIPLLKGWKEYQARRAVRADIEAWWACWPVANVGIVLGSISGMVAWDADDAEGLALLEGMSGGPIPPTLTFATGRGTRYLLAWPGALPHPPAHFASPGATLSFLGEGSYSVFPPSLHLNGREYAWVPGRGPGEIGLATIPPAQVGQLEARSTRTRPKITRCGPGAPPGPDRERLHRRASGWVKGCPGSTEKVDGHRKVFAIACSLIHGFDLTPAEACSLMMREWSPRCDPPWEEWEVMRECEGALDRGTFEPIPDATHRLNGPSRPRVSDTPTAPPTTPRNLDPGPVEAPPPPEDPPGFGAGQSKAPLFRLGSSLTQRPVKWLIEPWIQRGKLSAITGPAGSGKSTFGAWLMTRAGRAVVFPGAEEGADDEWFERLSVVGYPLSHVAFCDNREWSFPADRDRLRDVVKAHRADLVWIDPADEYVTEGSENDGTYIRAALKSLSWVAAQTGAAVVFVRHPGKSASNLMPGSRHWHTVPRAVLELIVDRTREDVRIIRPDKRSRGKYAPATYYHLDGPEDGARTWRWGAAVDREEVDEIKGEPDALNRSMIARGREMVRRLLAEGKMDSRAVISAGLAEGIEKRTLERAARREGVRYHREGNGPQHKCYWYVPGLGPDPLATNDTSH